MVFKQAFFQLALLRKNITVAPDDPDTRDFVGQIQQSISNSIAFNFVEVCQEKDLNHFKTMIIFQNEAAMDEAYEEDSASIYMGIVFNQTDSQLKYRGISL